MLLLLLIIIVTWGLIRRAYIGGRFQVSLGLRRLRLKLRQKAYMICFFLQRILNEGQLFAPADSRNQA